MDGHIQSAERKTCQPRILYLAKISFKSNEEIKPFPDKQKLREFVSTRSALQKTHKGDLQGEIK